MTIKFLFHINWIPRGMTRLFQFFLIFISVFQVSNTFADINLQGQMPHAEFLAPRYHFGDIYQGQVVSHQFNFQNTGNGTLIFTSLHASCGCVNAKTVAEDGVTTKNLFKPGEKGFVTVGFDSSQFSGYLTRTVTVETNSDLSSPTVTLTLTTNVKQEISTTPAMLYLGKIQKTDEETHYINMELRKQDVKVLNVESDLPFISAKMIPSSNPNKVKIAVQIQKTDTLPIGPFQGSLTVANTSQYYKNFKIPIMGEVIGHVQTSTKFLEFGVVNKDRVSDRSISFQSKNSDFVITGVKIDLNNFINFSKLSQKDLFEIQKKQVIIQQNGEPLNEYSVKFKLKYPSEKAVESNEVLLTGLNISGSFLIETNDPDYEQIKIPFFGILKQE